MTEIYIFEGSCPVCNTLYESNKDYPYGVLCQVCKEKRLDAEKKRLIGIDTEYVYDDPLKPPILRKITPKYG